MTILIGWGLNAAKWSVLRMLSGKNVEDTSDLNTLELPENHQLLLTDNIRRKFVEALDASQREELFPKFWQVLLKPRPQDTEIFSNLGWIQGWQDAETKEMEYLFKHGIIPEIQLWEKQVFTWVGIDPVGLKQYMSTLSPEQASTIHPLFIVKTDKDAIAERLEYDQNTPWFDNSWALRVWIDNSSEIIAWFWREVQSRAEESWFQVIDVSRDTNEKITQVSEEIKALMTVSK